MIDALKERLGQFGPEDKCGHDGPGGGGVQDGQYYLSELGQVELKIQGMIADAFFSVGYSDGRKCGRAQRVRKNNHEQKEQQEQKEEQQ